MFVESVESVFELRGERFEEKMWLRKVLRNKTHSGKEICQKICAEKKT